ncbi:DNA repair and recombination protein RAD54B-like [Xenia sp. Carnegie-2017]|uniref:DNA repair and recombination protein RAD54B-like n=1 Tax=Xenia sp. Carnegie-2017 TaxID=2897299 RepID=UPI001F04C34E|nr:DNA repair and recombination protein RAD54B-like [Xenia sp. Carnegie-2017]
MRRSEAPSQKPNGLKRPITTESKRFAAKKICLNNQSKNSFSKNDEEARDKENLYKCHFLKSKAKSSSFQTPVLNQNTSTSHLDQAKTEMKIEDNATCFYSVMWAKISKKKHKTWEGDGILLMKGKTAILQDSEGKEIGKSSGFKCSHLKKLTEGEMLIIGGKEVEVTGEIAKDDYLSGCCFQQVLDSEKAPCNLSAKTGPVKPFSNPQKKDISITGSCKRSSSTQPITARFNPLVPGALVMPRPNPLHQCNHNKKQLTVVDVVVDPYITNILRPHQKDGVVFLYECVMGMRNIVGNGAILADDMGLGKTLQCISLIWTLYKQGAYGGQPVAKRFLVISPGSLVKNWAAEFRKWLGNERILVYTVSSERKVEEFLRSPVFPVMVISYEMFVRYVEDMRKIKFDLVVCDEAHRLKNTAIKTTMHISSLNIPMKILLTGTPLQNDLTEFYSLADLCNPGVLGTPSSFRRVYEEPIVRGRQPGATNEEKELGECRATELKRLSSQFLLRRTSEINNKYLPGKVEAVVFCHASSLQQCLYEHLVSSRFFKSCLTFSCSSSLHLMCIAALKKLCNHPCLLYRKEKVVHPEISNLSHNDALYEDLQSLYPTNYNPDCSQHSGKLKVLENLLRIIRENSFQERVVVVSNYTQTLDIIQRSCERNKYPYLRLDGQTATNHRHSLVERFNMKGNKDFVFLLSSKAGGVGLNLTGASTLILYDIDWNPANDIQAMARVWRDGQRKMVKIYRLLTTGTIEEKIYQRQISKQGLSDAVSDAISSSSRAQDFSREDLKDLFTFHVDTSCLTHDLLNCSCSSYNETKGKNPVANVDKIPAAENSPRTCQLGVTKKTDQEKHLSMAELMQWKHFSRPIQDTEIEDIWLRSCADDIDFVFQTEIKKYC